MRVFLLLWASIWAIWETVGDPLIRPLAVWPAVFLGGIVFYLAAHGAEVESGAARSLFDVLMRSQAIITAIVGLIAVMIARVAGEGPVAASHKLIPNRLAGGRND